MYLREIRSVLEATGVLREDREEDVELEFDRIEGTTE
jgi:hypothetical protein